MGRFSPRDWRSAVSSDAARCFGAVTKAVPVLRADEPRDAGGRFGAGSARVPGMAGTRRSGAAGRTRRGASDRPRGLGGVGQFTGQPIGDTEDFGHRAEFTGGVVHGLPQPGVHALGPHLPGDSESLLREHH